MEHVSRTQNEKLDVKTTTCYMCACRCGICVHLREGEVRYIDGARLTQRLMRKPNALRGEARFELVSWEVALDTLEERLKHLRATDPKKFALFTGRDQMQALTGLFSNKSRIPNYTAHGGVCSANMAAGMIYTMGGSFWKFGGSDLDRAKLFFMIGTAEDHHSNPLKIAISKFDTPILIQLYSDVMQKFRLAAQERTKERQPPDHLRAHRAVFRFAALLLVCAARTRYDRHRALRTYNVRSARRSARN